MTSEAEEVVLSLLRANEEDDPEERHERILAHFAEDAVSQPIAWHEPHVGHAAMRAVMESMARSMTMSDFDFDVIMMVSSGGTVIIERTETATYAGVPVTMHVCGVAEVNPDGKIAAFRDYVDTAEFRRQFKRV